MYKVMTIIGTRPELIKMSRVINKFDNFFDHVLVHTGQNYDYELNQIFFKDLGIRLPDYFLNVAGKNTAQTIAKIIEKSDEVMEKEKPDALMLYGDTNSCLSIISAKRKKIPVFHMEAGNRCFDERNPEELNRKVIDHLADINLVLTEHARQHLIYEGIKSNRIFKTGSHLKEVLEFHKDEIESSDILKKLKLKPKSFFIVSMHREENIDNNLNLIELCDTLNLIGLKYKMPIIVSTHPRTNIKLIELNLMSKLKNVIFLKPFGFFDYIKLQLESKCVISDSGTITEEASILNLPAITIRNTHERPEGMDFGTLIMSGIKSDRVINAVDTIINSFDENIYPHRPINDYENPNVSNQIVRIVTSYIENINEYVWYKK